MATPTSYSWANPLGYLAGAATCVYKLWKPSNTDTAFIEDKVNTIALTAINQEAEARQAFASEENSDFRQILNAFETESDQIKMYEKQNEILRTYTLEAPATSQSDDNIAIKAWTKQQLEASYEKAMPYTNHTASYHACRFSHWLKKQTNRNPERIEILNFDGFKKFYVNICSKIILINLSHLTGSHLEEAKACLETIKETLIICANSQSLFHKNFENWQIACEAEVIRQTADEINSTIQPVEDLEPSAAAPITDAETKDQTVTVEDLEPSAAAPVTDDDETAEQAIPVDNSEYRSAEPGDTLNNLFVQCMINHKLKTLTERNSSPTTEDNMHIIALLLKFNPSQITSYRITDIAGNPNAFNLKLTSAAADTSPFGGGAFLKCSIPEGILYLKDQMDCTIQIDDTLPTNPLSITFNPGSELHLSVNDGESNIHISKIKVHTTTETCSIEDYSIKGSLTTRGLMNLVFRGMKAKPQAIDLILDSLTF